MYCKYDERKTKHKQSINKPRLAWQKHPDSLWQQSRREFILFLAVGSDVVIMDSVIPLHRDVLHTVTHTTDYKLGSFPDVIELYQKVIA